MTYARNAQMTPSQSRGPIWAVSMRYEAEILARRALIVSQSAEGEKVGISMLVTRAAIETAASPCHLSNLSYVIPPQDSHTFKGRPAPTRRAGRCRHARRGRCFSRAPTYLPSHAASQPAQGGQQKR